MKKYFVLLLILTPFVLQFCSSSRNIAKRNNITYTTHVQALMETHCTPCHFPPKGNKKAYDTYLAVRNDIDSIISRVSKNPGEKGFMPFKHPKLPDSTINVLVQWKKDGLLEN
jgi:hypothetical protein